MTIEINEDFQKALKILLETNDNVFITGKAGTGKTTFLKHFVLQCKKKVCNIGSNRGCSTKCWWRNNTFIF